MTNIFDFEDEQTAQTFDNISALRPDYSWLDELNPEQKSAVQTTDGPLLVLSGAGTGKTKVLTTRLAYILSTMKAMPHNCLVVTFTNRAAAEMKSRVRDMIGPMADSVWLGTFHSVCVKILRTYAELVNLKSNFTILNEDDQKRIIKKIIEDDGIDEKKYPPQAFVEKIQRLKDKGLSYDSIKPEQKRTLIAGVYEKYQKRLIELNCVDFGDIILYTLQILQQHADILEKYQEKFKYIMVDEYQDTNVIQYLFLRMLSQKHRNLCCVGDDDQSIYSWRGAEIENILRFEKDFTDAKVIRLERNYRSTANILKAASNLICHNDGRLGKTLKVADNSPALNCANDKIKLVSAYNGSEEAQYVANQIKTLKRDGYQYSNMAVLVRTAFQTREFEERFIAEAIAYQVIGGPKFYERQEIRDLLAYFRVVVQPDDDLALERIINKPARGIGAKSIEKFQDYARANHISMYQAIKQMLAQNLITGKAKNALQELMDNFDEWNKVSQMVSPDDLAAQILEDSGYYDMLKSDKSAEAPGRIENLKELLGVLNDKEKYPNLAVFLEHVSLVMDNDNAIDNNKVMLITLHSAKGLEFDVVFLPGWEEGLFPHQRSLDEGGSEALEEERRLAYVAITRAKQKLYILTAMSRRVYGQMKNNIPSRFINEIPTDCLHIINSANRQYYGGYQNYGSYNKTSTQNNYNRYSYETDDSYSAKSHTLKGVRVYHQMFGYGTIVAVEGEKCEVVFDKSGRKKIYASYLVRI
ncbi:MAG: UvrD-helicase domain-containing protein [Alphaproteobacteria bacterium]|nr:UvrD-helicase domain-containing protein [Alphaproteobacteria bacterium]